MVGLKRTGGYDYSIPQFECIIKGLCIEWQLRMGTVNCLVCVCENACIRRHFENFDRTLFTISAKVVLASIILHW